MALILQCGVSQLAVRLYIRVTKVASITGQFRPEVGIRNTPVSKRTVIKHEVCSCHSTTEFIVRVPLMMLSFLFLASQIPAGALGGAECESYRETHSLWTSLSK